MKDKDDLEDLFNFEHNENDLIKKAKRKSTIRMMATSGLVSVLILALLILIKLQVTPWLLDKEMAEQEMLYEIYGANLFVGPWEESVRLIGSKATAPTYKLLEGRPVFAGELANDSDRFEVHLTPNQFETYRYLGTKVMNFVHPGLAIDAVPNDLEKVDGIAEGRLIEMGLSFDRAYTFGEVRALLPDELKLQWAWVDIYTEHEVASMNTPEPAAHVLTEDEAVGFSLVDETGAARNNPVEQFAESLRYGKEHAGPYKKELEAIYGVLNDQGAIDETNIKIIGAVIVGEKQALQQLQNESSIRASSIGAVVDLFN